MSEYLIKSEIKDDTFGSTNIREHLPEDELTLSKNRLLEVDSFVE